MGLIVSHRHICPLLKKWKQARQGHVTVASCLDEQLLFLKNCVPLQEILKRRDFVDDTEDYEFPFSDDDDRFDNIDSENENNNKNPECYCSTSFHNRSSQEFFQSCCTVINLDVH